MLFTAVVLLTGVVQVYAIYLLMSCFFPSVKVPGWAHFCSYAALYGVMMAAYLLINVPFVNFISGLLATLGTAVLVYRGTLRKKAFASVLCYAVMLMSECVVAVIFGGVSYELFQTEKYVNISTLVIITIVQLIVVLLIRNLKHIREGEQIPVAYWITMTALPLFSIYIHIVLCMQPTISDGALIVCTAVLFAMNLFVFYLYDSQVQAFRVKKEQENLILQNQYQLKQLEMMREMGEQMREIRHDLRKHFSMIAYYNEQRATGELADYLRDMETHAETLYQYVDTGNFALDCILNYKLQEAHEREIETEIQIDIPRELELSAYDMNIILSNLLDNSLEALRTCEQNKLHVTVRYQKPFLCIQVKNPYRGPVIIRDGSYRTTKKDGGRHGYGLKNVARVVEKYEGNMTVCSENQMFEVIVTLTV